MRITRTSGLAAVLTACLAAAPAGAVVIGTPGVPGQAVGFPFGANPGGRYQQAYGGGGFDQGSVRITELSFFASSSPTAPLASGNYTLSLSTTQRGIDGLEDLRNTNFAASDAAVFNSNVGADSAVVFSGALPAVSAGRLTFALSTPFTYNPNVGALLLDVQSAPSTAPSVFLDLTNDPAVPTGRLFGTTTGITSQPNGLVTDIIGVPEPASMALLGVGLLGLAGLRRRRVA